MQKQTYIAVHLHGNPTPDQIEQAKAQLTFLSGSYPVASDRKPIGVTDMWTAYQETADGIIDYTLYVHG